MPSRKSSAASRLQESSDTTTTNTEEDRTGGHRRENNTKPHRNPIDPPPGEELQKREGFRRFLRKHSSPTHQRVTAGGRIVPMEPLANGRSGADRHSTSPPFNRAAVPTGPKAQLDGTAVYGVPGGVISGRSKQSQDSIARLVSAVHASNSNFCQERASVLANGTGMSFANDHPVVPELCIAAPPVPAWFNGPMAGQFPGQVPVSAPDANMALGVYGNNEMCQSMYSAGTVPKWRQDPCLNGHIWSDQCASAHGPTSQRAATAQQSLAYWQARYDELDQQLKIMDRHRAMSNLNHGLANQRAVIVQQRSDVKDMIDSIRTFLQMEQQIGTARHAGLNGFNADAPAYVPVACNKSVPSTSSGAFHLLELGVTGVREEKPAAVKGRHAIPIVAPPEKLGRLSETPSKKHANDTKLKSEDVDEWGVNVGDAPTELRRQQSDMSMALHSGSGRSMESRRPSSDPSADSLFPNQTEGLPSSKSGDSHDDANNADAAFLDLTKTQAGKDSSPIEQILEKQLKAMRQPKGVVTTIRLSNGSMLDVAGQDLEQAAEDDLVDSQRAHCVAGAHMNDLTGTQTRQVQDSSNNSKENAGMYSNKLQRPGSMTLCTTTDCATPRKVERCSILEPPGHEKEKQRHVLREIYSNNTTESYSAKLHVKHDQMNSASVDLAASPDKSSMDTTPRRNPSLVPDQTSPRELNNKGYSLVSLQDVHAIGQLPRNFDGATDAGRWSKSRSTSKNNTKSPRLLLSRAEGRGAWYGPYCRDLIERALHNDGADGAQKSCDK